MLTQGAGQFFTSVEKNFPNFNRVKGAVQPWTNAFTSLSLFP